MIPMECPKCGRRGEVPLDRLNSKLTCRNCATVFHMDQTGQIVLGAPDDPAKAKRRPDVRLEPLEFNPVKLFKSIPRPVRIGLAAAAVLAVVWVAAGALIDSIGVPRDLDRRADYVAEAFVDLQLDRIQELSTPASREAVKKWYDQVRPTLDLAGPRSRGDEAAIGSQVISEEDDKALTYSSIIVSDPTVVAPQGGAPPGTARKSVTLELAWTRDGGRWLLDGDETLKQANRPKRPGGRLRGRR